ncbi:histidinol-phosphate transaminase [Vannielia litorea]|uniref:Histidinol-phosphate aminotransferase n=1 Tax=Vannielia litorea TaxID=1217970 RepID=A0A1N6E5G7_9RHOB|nr:histidinol-phosphate transaminase [Vannielia litorea]SIN78259.1 histidinol-phosphate aminotransferase [Vannielia litorea]
MSAPIPQPGISEIALYQSGKSTFQGVENPLKLSANENPFGCSPRVAEAIAAELGSLHRYPGTDHQILREAIAKAHDLPADQVICGVGSDEILHLAAQAYAGPGGEVVYTEHGFSVYPIVARAAGAEPVVAPERDRVADADAILSACNEKTKIVFLANPNNPTGTMIGGNEVVRLADGLPEGCLLVLDGAYAEFVEGFDGGASLAATRDNVLMTRTFSKIYGLGGLRVGWGFGPREIIDTLTRIRGPFNLSNMQIAGAVAALEDVEFTEKSRAENSRNRALLARGLTALGIPSDPSFANFILARFAGAEEAEAAFNHLGHQGLIVRQVGGYGLPDCLRITIGTEENCRAVLAALEEFKSAR